MIYLGGDFMDQFKNLRTEENEFLPSFFNEIEIPDNYDDGFDEEAFDALCLRFAKSYIKKVIPITIDLYPQFRTKKAILKEKLMEDGKDACAGMFELQDDYIDYYAGPVEEESESSDICISSIEAFIRNSALDHMLENYDEWFKKKISFENIYVESFCAGVYVKRIHSMLLNMLHEFFPAMRCLPPEQLNQVHASMIMDAWFAYATLTTIDPDELNNSTVINNLEDYEFEPLLKWPGPQIVRNAAGRITEVSFPMNEPNPALIPELCLQCKRYYDNENLNKLCKVTRFDQRNAEDFKCRAYEKQLEG